jgi:AI-2 transport protein TqsA
MKTERTLGTGNVMTITGAALIVFMIGILIRQAKPILFPFFLAVLLSFILAPVLDFLTRLKIPRAVSIILLLIMTFVILYLLGILFYESGKGFASEFPKYGDKLRAGVEYIENRFHMTGVKWDPLNWVATLDVNKLGSLVLSSLGPFFSFLSNLFLVLIFLIFILAGKGKVETKVETAFSRANAVRIRRMIHNINGQIQRYLAIKTISNLVSAALTALILTLFGLNFAFLFGFLAFVLNYIPTLGSIMATALPMLIAAFQFPTLWPAFWIGVLMTVIQNVMGNFVEPKLMGRGLDLSPLVVLFALFFWGWLWGIAGMILAVPIVAVVKIVCNNIPALKFIAVLMSS